MSAPSLSAFTSQLRQRDVARPTHYYVEIVPPKAITKNTKNFANIDPNLVSMWCSQAMTPQTTIATRDEYLEAGVRRKYAFDQDYQNLTLHFYLDQSFDIQLFFDQWKNAVVPQRRKFGWPEDYTANALNLFIINQDEEITYKYEYSNVFPKSINSVDLSYATGGSVSTFSVDFVFEEVYYTSVKGNKTSKPKAQEKTPVKAKNVEVYQSQTQLDQLDNLIF